jgi:hypothetical protein
MAGGWAGHVAQAVLPARRRLSTTGWNLLCAVDDGKHVDLIGLDVVDDSKGRFQNLPDLRDAEFRDLTARQGEFSDLLRAPGQPVNHVQGVLRGTSCDVGVYGP